MDRRRGSLLIQYPHSNSGAYHGVGNNGWRSPAGAGQSETANIYAAYAGVVPNVSSHHPHAHPPLPLKTIPAAVAANAAAAPIIMWWDEDRIEATVDRQYVLSHLHPDDHQRLDKQVNFGDGLTDYTYFEWIEGKAKRIFLILVDIGVPDQIFGIVDDSWDDDDLPVRFENVERLQLTRQRDEKLERKFFHRQFTYLLRFVNEGQVFFYDDVEVVPIETIEKRVPVPVVGHSHNDVDKVYLPGKADDVFFRRRIPFGLGQGRMPQEEFLSGIEQMRLMAHPHIASLWAAYVHQSIGYVLLTPVSETSLKSFLHMVPPSIKIMTKQDRRMLLLNWLNCLAEALASLHEQGFSHRNIKPSNILLDGENNIFFSDCGTFAHHQAGDSKRSFDKEMYDYAAPEIAERHAATAGPRLSQSRIPSTIPRRPTTATVDSTASAMDQNSSSGDSIYTVSTSTTISYTSPTSPTSPSEAHSHAFPVRIDPQKSDVFTLACIFLEILTVLLKRAPRNFQSHRSAKNKTAGRGGGLPDSSFHKNLDSVESWIFILLKDAKKKEDRLFRGISHILNLVTRMLEPNPSDRPTIQHVSERLHEILTKVSGIEDPHCTAKKHWNIVQGMSQLRTIEEGVFPPKKQSTASSLTPSLTHSRTGSLGTSSFNAEVASTTTKRSSSSGNTNSTDGRRIGVGGGRGPGGYRDPRGKQQGKAKAWQAPVYAEISFG